MIEKIISIGDLLNIKMCLTQKDYADITRRFTNLKVSTYYDFEIHYKRIAKLKSMEVGIRKPFRNAIYVVKKITIMFSHILQNKNILAKI